MLFWIFLAPCTMVNQMFSSLFVATSWTEAVNTHFWDYVFVVKKAFLCVFLQQFKFYKTGRNLVTKFTAFIADPNWTQRLAANEDHFLGKIEVVSPQFTQSVNRYARLSKSFPLIVGQLLKHGARESLWAKGHWNFLNGTQSVQIFTVHFGHFHI